MDFREQLKKSIHNWDLVEIVLKEGYAISRHRVRPTTDKTRGSYVGKVIGIPKGLVWCSKDEVEVYCTLTPDRGINGNQVRVIVPYNSIKSFIVYKKKNSYEQTK